MNDRHLPDKAIDVIDEAGAAQRVLPKSKQRKVIGKHEIELVIAKLARIPPQSVSNDDCNKLKTLDRDLKSIVFGQDKAIDALAAAIKMARSGLGNIHKPIGSFLFLDQPVLEKLRWLDNWLIFLVFPCTVLICLSIWSAMPFRD